MGNVGDGEEEDKDGLCFGYERQPLSLVSSALFPPKLFMIAEGTGSQPYQVLVT